VTHDRISIDFNDEQSEKTLSSIRVRVNPDSKSNPNRLEHPEKHFVPRTVTEDGITIDFSDEQFEKALSLI
jgi:hypothetical protein